NDVSIRIFRGNRVAIVGPNGAGKTTLLNMLIGRTTPDSGNVKIGTNVAMAALDQNRSTLHPETTLSAVLTGGVGDMVEVDGKPRHVVSYMKDFLFLPEQARTPVRVLSGGERARLLLAKVLAEPSNLLVLDEPTNDLDLETLDLLEEMIADYPGTVLVVSHDRDFLDRVATSLLMAEDNGTFVEYAGGYTDMLAQRGVGVTARQAARTAGGKATASREALAGRKRKLTFSDQHALKTLPEQMAALEKEIATLQSKLADGNLYARDASAYNALSTELHTAQTELSTCEHRWLELELLREDIAKAE
ncbi:MAG TPA: ATP-binding cassette domain-containing protein, partial [Rhizomicrobium sp.]|nr:ATP-binding cassette domain-containing protein [Rhizomicrobium sp.]